jgi:hypothetical protein
MPLLLPGGCTLTNKRRLRDPTNRGIAKKGGATQTQNEVRKLVNTRMYAHVYWALLGRGDIITRGSMIGTNIEYI